MKRVQRLVLESLLPPSAHKSVIGNHHGVRGRSSDLHLITRSQYTIQILGRGQPARIRPGLPYEKSWNSNLGTFFSDLYRVTEA